MFANHATPLPVDAHQDLQPFDDVAGRILRERPVRALLRSIADAEGAVAFASFRA